jgi:hypothetical protein
MKHYEVWLNYNAIRCGLLEVFLTRQNWLSLSSEYSQACDMHNCSIFIQSNGFVEVFSQFK